MLFHQQAAGQFHEFFELEHAELPAGGDGAHPT